MTTARVTLPLDNLGSDGEALAIERTIATTPGVIQISINPLTEMAYVVYDPTILDAEHLQAVLDHVGYGAPLPAPHTQPAAETMQPALPRWDQRGPRGTGGEATHTSEQPRQPSWRWSPWTLSLLIVTVLASIAVWGWSRATALPPANSAPAPALAEAAPQTNEGGQVTITATWQGSAAGPVFAVAMNTHAIDLDGYDLQQLATLRIDGGRQVQPVSWEAPKGGHHRSGTLTFPATAADGTPLIAPGTQTIELVIRDVAGVPERVFVWQQ